MPTFFLTLSRSLSLSHALSLALSLSHTLSCPFSHSPSRHFPIFGRLNREKFGTEILFLGCTENLEAPKLVENIRRCVCSSGRSLDLEDLSSSPAEPRTFPVFLCLQRLFQNLKEAALGRFKGNWFGFLKLRHNIKLQKYTEHQVLEEYLLPYRASFKVAIVQWKQLIIPFSLHLLNSCEEKSPEPLNFQKRPGSCFLKL